MTTEGMAGYICECNVKGIGKKLSQDIVVRFGRKTFDVILKDWKRLTGVGSLLFEHELNELNELLRNYGFFDY